MIRFIFYLHPEQRNTSIFRITEKIMRTARGVYNLYAFSKAEDGTLTTELLHENEKRYERIVMTELGK